MRSSLPTTVIEPTRGWSALGLIELVRYRELIYFFVWRDIKVRYKQTFFGVAWAILQPVLTTLVFTLFFGRLAGIETGGVPYVLFSFCGVLPWTFFSQGITQASNSLVGSASLITKVYFPRLIVPLATVVACVLDFILGFTILIALMAYHGRWPDTSVVWLPALAGLALASALGVGAWLSALNVEYRDVRYVVPFLVQIWLFVTPVIYPSEAVTAKLGEMGLPEWIYGLNPMVGVLAGFRWALLGEGAFPGDLLAASTAVAAVILVSGLVNFHRVERTFADVV